MSYGRGHVKGTRKVKPQDSAWYREQEESNIRRIEAEWQAKQAVQLDLIPDGQLVLLTEKEVA